MPILTITQHDVVQAYKLHQKMNKKGLIKYMATIFVLVVVGLILLSHYYFIWGCGLLGGAIGSTVGYGLQRYIYTPWRAKKVYAQQKSLHQLYSLEWNEKGLESQGENRHGITPWSHIIKWRQNQTVYNLYLSDALYLIVPKHIFETAQQQQQQFETYLQPIEKNSIYW